MTNIHHGNGTNTGSATKTFVKYPDNIEENSIGEIIQIHSGNSNASVELTYNHYNTYTLTPEQRAAVGSLATGYYYWLASPCVDCDYDYVYFNVRCTGSGEISYNSLFNSNGNAGNGGSGVRAVVSI